MKKMIKAILFVFGIIFLGNGIFTLMVGRFNFGVTASFILGIFFLVVFKFEKKIAERIKKTKFGKVLLVIFILAVIFFIFTETVILINEKREYTEKCDAVIVLGAGLRGEEISLTLAYRLDRAIEYLELYPDTLIVVSGGQGLGESISEAQAMKKYLISKGVAEDQIISEDKSTSTTENFKFSKVLLDDRFEDKEYKVCYTTNGFHIYRAGLIAEKQGFDADGLTAKNVWYMEFTNRLREFFAVVKMWVLGY